MGKTMGDAIKERAIKFGTNRQTYKDFKVGMKVKNISFCADFFFYHGNEKGIVTKVEPYYIVVKFTPKLQFEDGTFHTGGCFEPLDLVILDRPKRKKIVCPKCKYHIPLISKDETKQTRK